MRGVNLPRNSKVGQCCVLALIENASCACLTPLVGCTSFSHKQPHLQLVLSLGNEVVETATAASKNPTFKELLFLPIRNIKSEQLIISVNGSKKLFAIEDVVGPKRASPASLQLADSASRYTSSYISSSPLERTNQGQGCNADLCYWKRHR